MKISRIEPYTIAYKLFGRRVQKYKSSLLDLHTQIRKGGMKTYVMAYASFIIMTSLVTFALSMTILPILLPFIMHFPLFSVQNFAFSTLFAILLTIMTAMLIYAYPGIKSTQRRAPIDANLTYITSFMTMLSSSNVPPRMIFRSMASIDTLKEIHQEFGNIVRDVEVFGQDLLTSIAENVKYTPSTKLQEILTGYVSSIRTGGDPTEYLRISTENTIKEKMVGLDLMLESLSALAEIYIMVLVAMPLLFVAMFSVLGMLGGQGVMDPAMILFLLTYIGIPIMATTMIVFISGFTQG